MRYLRVMDESPRYKGPLLIKETNFAIVACSFNYYNDLLDNLVLLAFCTDKIL